MFMKRFGILQCFTELLLPSRSLWSALPHYPACSLTLFKYVSTEEGFKKKKRKRKRQRMQWVCGKLSGRFVCLRGVAGILAVWDSSRRVTVTVARRAGLFDSLFTYFAHVGFLF